jgi:CBS domain-containing protein
MHKCSDVMTSNPVCCMLDDSTAKLAQMMAHSDIGPVIVVQNGKQNKLAGIVTDRDLALKVVAQGRDPHGTTAAEVMTRNVATVHPDDDIERALSIMKQQQVRRIPVVDSNDSVVGIVSQADVATRIDEPFKTAAVVKEISETRNSA